MIEVEVRGKLNEQSIAELENFFGANGKLVRKFSREMYLLHGYPGYDGQPMLRQTDIRLRNTDGDCEIMVKHKASENNIGRHEISLKLRDTDLETAKLVVKALGFTGGLWMRRQTAIYEYGGIEWSLVRALKGFCYFEAEKTVATEDQINAAHQDLVAAAAKLKLEVLSPEQTVEYIERLDREVNKEVDF